MHVCADHHTRHCFGAIVMVHTQERYHHEKHLKENTKMNMRTIWPFLLTATLVIPIVAGCDKSKANSGISDQTADQTTVDLAGSKQGLAVGFVDVDGDGIEDKIVGAPYAAAPSGTGAVLVYKGSASGYSTDAAFILTGDDNLGYSFVNLGDIDGDGKADFAIGAIHGSGDDSGATSLCGSVAIYKGGGSGQIIKKLAGDGPMDKFGYALAAGDLNNDGVNDLIVSAPFNTHDPALYQSGAVYVYFGPDFTTASRVALFATSVNKSLGLAVAAGDMNNDGIADLVLSASGRVLVYYGNVNFAPSLNTQNLAITSIASGFGKSLAVIGDLDGDGMRELAVGAPNAVINSSRDIGSVYIVKGSATGTVHVSAATPPASLLVRIDGEGLFSRFGSSIIATGDLEGGGKPDFVVGAPMTDVTTTAGQNILSGKTYLLKGEALSPSTTLADAAVFTGVVENQGYGTALAVNSNKGLLIGAPRSNADTGGVSMVDAATGLVVPGGSSGGATGTGGDCH